MARLGKLWEAHPNLLSWLLLAIGMVIMRADRGAVMWGLAGAVGRTDRRDRRPGGAVRLDHQLGRSRRGADTSGAAARQMISFQFPVTSNE